MTEQAPGAARPRAPKYDPLGEYLRADGGAEIVLTLGEIDALVGGLPTGAATPQFWANARDHHQSRRGHWLSAGYRAFLQPSRASVKFVRGESGDRSGRLWIESELAACVSAYREFQLSEAAGEQPNKTALRRRVLDESLPGRRETAYEFRMQNISALLDELGLPFIRGYPPMRNVGRQKPALLRLINAAWDREADRERPTADPAAFATRVVSALGKSDAGSIRPEGETTPPRTMGVTTAFRRDPAVAAWVLIGAAGVCEVCCEPAPFLRIDGRPYLEVHHMRPLADGGPDTTDNAVAACPNCHRRLHTGADRSSLRRRTIRRIPRLIDHPVRRLEPPTAAAPADVFGVAGPIRGG